MRKSLQVRAKMLAKVRAFFAEKNVLEVDTDLLRPCPAIDATIDPIQTSGGYLVTSPEYAMKTLISKGSGDIYQLSHVFRANEQGPWHSCEFTMIEYYRIGMEYRDFMHEVADLVELFTGPLPRQILTYDEALNLHPTPDPDPSWDTDTALNFRFTHIEPHLGQDKLTIITDYPLTQAALAKTTETAQRFEIYFRGVELCNGYDELTDPATYKKRLIEQNTLRSDPLPLDTSFLESLNLPPCCGVALGFDRLLALHTHSSTIHQFPLSRRYTHPV